MDGLVIYSDPVKLWKFETARKVAFMMAWHPRLGQDSLIRSYVPKDVGKLIANNYLSVDSQLSIESTKHEIYTKPQDLLVGILNGWNMITRGDNSQQLKLIRAAFVDKSLTRHSQIVIQTPPLRIPYDLQGQSTTNLLTQVSRESDNWFVDWLSEIDNGIQSGLRKAILQQQQGRSLKFNYHPSFKNDPLGRYPPVFKIRIPGLTSRVNVYDKNRKLIGFAHELWQKGVFGRGAEVVVIIKHGGIWDNVLNNSFTNQWVAQQILLIKSALDVKNECLFDFNDDLGKDE